MLPNRANILRFVIQSLNPLDMPGGNDGHLVRNQARPATSRSDVNRALQNAGVLLNVGPACRLPSRVARTYVLRPASAPQVKVLQELFPSLNPLGLVEGAPMLLALSESTLRAKSEAWRNVLEARVEQPWEQVQHVFSFFPWNRSC